MAGAVRMRSVGAAAVVAATLAVPGVALAQNGQSNPLAPGLPQPSVTVPTASTPTVITAPSTSGPNSGLSGGSVIAIAIGALALLGGISFFIWRDARRRAPVRTRTATATAGASGSGSKQRPKPRKLSPAERRRRKRGRAR